MQPQIKNNNANNNKSPDKPIKTACNSATKQLPSVQILTRMLCIPSIQKQQLKQDIIKYIKPLSFKSKQQFGTNLKNALYNKYRGIVGNKHVQQQHNQNNNADNNAATQHKQQLAGLIASIGRINQVLKQVQVSTPIIDIFNQLFIDLLAQAIQNKTVTKQQLLTVWESVPCKNIEYFLDVLHLWDQFTNMPDQIFTKSMLNLLIDTKIQQVCHYCRFHRPIPQFQSQILLPKLLTTDQIYSTFVLQLLKHRKQLKQQLISQIDLSKAVIILQQIGQDPRTYKRVNDFILRKHYKSMIHQYQYWYVFQDKMGFNRQFIQWYCEEFGDAIGEEIRESIRVRNGIQSKYDKEVIKNPLYQYDQFNNTQEILKLFKDKYPPPKSKSQPHSSSSSSLMPNLCLQQFAIKQSQVYFISSSQSPQFQHMISILPQSKYLGFDAQYRCTSTKYQQLGVAIVQISNGSQIFLVDFMELENNEKFKMFFKNIFKSQEICIVGHSLQSDINFIQRTMKIDKCQGNIDIAKIFKEKFPNQTQNSLAFMTQTLIGKNLCKYQQRSNWNRRPLKKSQAHYAALDAQICLKLFQILKQKQVTLTEAVIKNKKKSNDLVIIRKDNIIYREDQQYMLTESKPKFVVDSMLKRLCSLLRNLGIDAQFMSISNYEQMQQLAKRQNRIVLTRDRKLLAKKSPVTPIYCIVQRGDSDLMLDQIIKQFKIDLAQFAPLSRCVKCNGDELIIIDKEQAMKYVNFEYEDTNIKQFWKCAKCKQIYWEGNQWKSAKKRFQTIADQSIMKNSSNENEKEELQKQTEVKQETKVQQKNQQQVVVKQQNKQKVNTQQKHNQLKD